VCSKLSRFCSHRCLTFWQDLYLPTFSVKVKSVLAGKWQYVFNHNPRYPVIESGHQNRQGGSEEEKSMFVLWIELRITGRLTRMCRTRRGRGRFIRTLQIDIDIDILVNCNWVVTRWQQYSTHLHTNSTQNDTKQTIHRTTQQFGRVRAVPRLG